MQRLWPSYRHSQPALGVVFLHPTAHSCDNKRKNEQKKMQKSMQMCKCKCTMQMQMQVQMQVQMQMQMQRNQYILRCFAFANSRCAFIRAVTAVALVSRAVEIHAPRAVVANAVSNPIGERVAVPALAINALSQLQQSHFDLPAKAKKKTKNKKKMRLTQNYDAIVGRSQVSRW